MSEKGAKASTPRNTTVHVRALCGTSFIQPGGLMRRTCRQHHESTLESCRRRGGERPHHIAECHGSRPLRARHGIQAGCAGSQREPGLRLANLLPTPTLR